MGELLKSKEARLARWKEHFDEVLVNWEIPELSPQEYEEDGWCRIKIHHCIYSVFSFVF